jgi:hypothetical protein
MTLSNNLVFLDTETTGLTLEHDVWEIAFAVGDGPVYTYQVEHSLRNADLKALEINGYRDRVRSPEGQDVDSDIHPLLKGKTIVGANPSFDAYRLERRWGRAPWHHRLVDVESMAVPLLRLEKPLGLKGLVDELTVRGFSIPENDHTAAGDVVTVREVYKVLMYHGWVNS